MAITKREYEQARRNFFEARAWYSRQRAACLYEAGRCLLPAREGYYLGHAMRLGLLAQDNADAWERIRDLYREGV